MMKRYILWALLPFFVLMGCQGRAEPSPTVCVSFYECGAWKECASIDWSTKTLVGATQDRICTEAQFRFKENHVSALSLEHFRLLSNVTQYLKQDFCEESVGGGDPEKTFPIGGVYYPACCAKIKPCSTGPVKLDQ